MMSREPIFRAILCVVLAVLPAVTACTPSTGGYACDLDAVALTAEAMPDGWAQKWIVLPPVLDTLGASDAYNVVMEKRGEIAQHTVYRCADERAARSLLRSGRYWFFPSGWAWEEASGAENLSLHADRQVIKCGESGDIYLGKMCTAVLQYGRYVSDFTVPIQDGVMTREEFFRLVRHIDATFQKCGGGDARFSSE